MAKNSDPPPSYSEPPPYSRFRSTLGDERTALLLARDRTPPQYARRYYQDTLDNQRIHLYPHSHSRCNRNRNRSRNPWLRILALVGAAFLMACVLLGVGVGAGWHRVGRRPVRVVRVAVVGAGPAGVGVAWALGRESWGRESWGRESWGRGRGSGVRVEVVVFERRERGGGRLVVVGDGNATETGTGMGTGSGMGMGMLGSRHLGMQDLATGPLLGEHSVLRARAKSVSGFHPKSRDKAASTPPKRETGFFSLDEHKLIAKIPRPASATSWSEWWALLWRYGPSIWKAKTLPSKPSSFLALAGTFPSIAAMAQRADLSSAIARSGTQRVADVGVGDAYQREVLAPQLRRQLGQETCELSELALATALWQEGGAGLGTGTGTGTGVHATEDALEVLLRASGAEVRLNTEVVGWTRRRSDAGFGAEKWDVKTQTQTQGQDTAYEYEYEAFDHVVVAAPLDERFRGLLGVGPETLSYRDAWSAFVLVRGGGGLNVSLFGDTGDVDEILLVPRADGTAPEGLGGVQAISHVRDLYGPDLDSTSTSSSNVSAEAVHALYRVSSSRGLDNAALGVLFGGHAVVGVREVRVESAWPLLWPRGAEGLRELGGFRVKGRKEGEGHGDGDGKGEGGSADLGLWWTGAYEGIVMGVEEAWVVGENVGRLVAEQVRR